MVSRKTARALEEIATELQDGHDRAVIRLTRVMAAADRLKGFASHDDDCTVNRFPMQGVCSCGYTSAYRAYLDATEFAQ